MTDARIREAMVAEAVEAPDTGDLWARTTRRIRRRRLRRWGSAAVGMLAAVAVGGGVLAGSGERHEHEVVLGDPGVPEGWEDVVVGEAVLSVPPDWQVVDLTAVRPEEAEPDVVEEGLEDGEGERVPEPVPCPAIDPDRPVLVHSRQGLPVGCPEDPATLTGLAVVPLDGPARWGFPPAVLEAGERVEVGGVPARAVDAALVTTSATTDAAELVATDATTLVAPGVGVHVEVRADAHADVIHAVLETLRPRSTFDPEAVLHLTGVYDAEPGARHERQLVGWAIDPEGRYHRWFHEPVDPQAQGLGAKFWPAPTANRFGGIVHTGEQTRVVAARPGDDAPSVFTLPEANPEAVAWSPDGEAVAWLVLDPEPRLAVADWGHPDLLADGADPERVEFAATGLPDPEAHRDLMLAWEDDDRGEHLIAYTRPEDTHIVEVQRDNGRLDLTDPLTFRPGGRLR